MKNTISLRKNEDFRKIYKKRKSKSDRYFVVYIEKNELNKNRLGISVSKKVGNSVVRHRIKRIVKECYRLNEENVQIGYDIVVVAKKESKDIDYRYSLNSLLFLLKKQGIYQDGNNN